MFRAVAKTTPSGKIREVAKINLVSLPGIIALLPLNIPLIPVAATSSGLSAEAFANPFNLSIRFIVSALVRTPPGISRQVLTVVPLNSDSIAFVK